MSADAAAHAAHVALADGLSARHLLGWLALLDGARDALVARGAQPLAHAGGALQLPQALGSGP